MNIDPWSGVLGAVIAGIVALIGLVAALPKSNAEARKANAEAERTHWQTLHDEIKRLDRLTKGLREELDRIGSVVEESKKRESALDRENLNLRVQVRKLSKRVTDLEAVFKIGPIPPDMQAALDRLDATEETPERHRGK